MVFTISSLSINKFQVYSLVRWRNLKMVYFPIFLTQKTVETHQGLQGDKIDHREPGGRVYIALGTIMI